MSALVGFWTLELLAAAICVVSLRVGYLWGQKKMKAAWVEFDRQRSESWMSHE